MWCSVVRMGCNVVWYGVMWCGVMYIAVERKEAIRLSLMPATDVNKANKIK